MINPENLNISELPWLPLSESSAFPSEPAIYIAIDSNNTIQYIGRSENPRKRWRRHHKYEQLSSIGNIKIVYLFVDDLILLSEIESALINHFQPRLNCHSISRLSDKTIGCRIFKVDENTFYQQVEDLDISPAELVRKIVHEWVEDKNEQQSISKESS